MIFENFTGINISVTTWTATSKPPIIYVIHLKKDIIAINNWLSAGRQLFMLQYAQNYDIRKGS